MDKAKETRIELVDELMQLIGCERKNKDKQYLSRDELLKLITYIKTKKQMEEANA